MSRINFLIVTFLTAPFFIATATAAEAQNFCIEDTAQGPMQVSSDCVDPLYAQPVIDSRRKIAEPFPLYHVSGHFQGTGAKFNFYFPEREKWEGRFFQQVYPLTDGQANEETLRFGLDSGAYTVQTVSSGGYRSDAAAAKLAKTLAREYYRMPDRRIYGYIYGGSGGSYQTIGAIENTTGVWDGAVPYVVGAPTSIPNNFFIRAFARLVLKDKARQIADAVRPGGNGDPNAALNETERAVLKEVTAMGVPLRGWDDFSYILGLNDPLGLLSFADTVKSKDPTYADDFWHLPGYVGTERSALGDLVRSKKISHVTNVVTVDKDSQGIVRKFKLEGMPTLDSTGGLDYTFMDATGKSLGSITGQLDLLTNTFTLGKGNSESLISSITLGGKVLLENKWALALTTYHRHQIPPTSDYAGWSQFINNNGTPKYPQRKVNVGSEISLAVSGGGTHTGKIQGKVIVVSNTLDVDAFPWHADWYAKRVYKALGARHNDNFRVWLNDNADHLDGSVIASGSADAASVRLISYVGIFQQAVRDISLWVEKGISPPNSTSYSVTNGQVSLAKDALSRRGIQPTLSLTANGKMGVEVLTGQPVTLRGKIRVPPGAGKIIAVEWSQTGTDNFVPVSLTTEPQEKLSVEKTYTYSKEGIYYAVLRVTAQREADTHADVRLVRNLARVRVIVTQARSPK